MKRSLKQDNQFLKVATISVVSTIVLALYISYLAFESKNSYTVYSTLQIKKSNLNYEIRQLQYENAKLQKEFLELKNLEPE